MIEKLNIFYIKPNKRDAINPFVEIDLEISRKYSFDYDESTLDVCFDY